MCIIISHCDITLKWMKNNNQITSDHHNISSVYSQSMYYGADLQLLLCLSCTSDELHGCSTLLIFAHYVIGLLIMPVRLVSHALISYYKII